MTEQETGFEVIYTTADIGLRVKASTLEDIFKYGAFGLFSIMYEGWPGTGVGSFNKEKEKFINLENAVLPYLFVDWLNELIFIDEAENFVPTNLHINLIVKTSSWILNAVAKSPLRRLGLQKKIEVKAATYHNLELTNYERTWRAAVILDI